MLYIAYFIIVRCRLVYTVVYTVPIGLPIG